MGSPRNGRDDSNSSDLLKIVELLKNVRSARKVQPSSSWIFLRPLTVSTERLFFTFLVYAFQLLSSKLSFLRYHFRLMYIIWLQYSICNDFQSFVIYLSI